MSMPRYCWHCGRPLQTDPLTRKLKYRKIEVDGATRVVHIACAERFKRQPPTPHIFDTARVVKSDSDEGDE